MALKVGATLVLEQSFTFPQAVLQARARGEGHRLPAACRRSSRCSLQMKDLQPGTLPAPALRDQHRRGAAARAHRAAAGALPARRSIFSMYGLTECKRCTYLPPERARRAGPARSASRSRTPRPMSSTSNGERVGPGVVGELVIRGAHVMKGYWEKPEATDERAASPARIPGRRCSTPATSSGTTRTATSTSSAAWTTSSSRAARRSRPKEVENVLYALAGRPRGRGHRRARSDPRPGDQGGRRADPEARPHRARLIRHCAKHLEDFMVPKIVEFRDDLPKTENGKISRRLVGPRCWRRRLRFAALQPPGRPDLFRRGAETRRAAEVERIAGVLRTQVLKSCAAAARWSASPAASIRA